MTRRISSCILVVALFVGCSSPRPTPTRKDAVLSGEETAKKAADAARAAEKAGNTGVLAATSNREPPPPPPEPPPAPPAAELLIHLIKGSPTSGGQPLEDVGKYISDALAAEPNTIVVITADTDTKYEKVVELLDAVDGAGGSFVLRAAAAPIDEPPAKP